MKLEFTSLEQLPTELTKGFSYLIERMQGIELSLSANNPSTSVTVTSEQIYTPEEAAKFLKIGRTKLWELTKNGVVKGHRLQAMVRYKHSELVEALEQIQTLKTKATK